MPPVVSYVEIVPRTRMVVAASGAAAVSGAAEPDADAPVDGAVAFDPGVAPACDVAFEGVGRRDA